MRSVLSALRGMVPEFKSGTPLEKRPDYRLGARRGGPEPGPAVAILKAGEVLAHLEPEEVALLRSVKNQIARLPPKQQRKLGAAVARLALSKGNHGRTT